MNSQMRIGIGLVFVSAICLMISLLHKAEVTTSVPFSTNEGSSGELKLTVPGNLRLGETEKISLKVSTSKGSTTPSFEVISRLELGGIEVHPTGEIKGLMGQDGTVGFEWNLRSTKVESIHAILWLYFENQGIERQLLFARAIDLKSVAFFGLSYPSVKWFAGIGLFLGVGLLITGLVRTNSKI